MYPQTVVPLTDPIHKALTDGWNDESKTDVTQLKDEFGNAVYYTANRDVTAWNPTDESTWEKNSVYSYKGDRYVKVTPHKWSTGTQYVFSDSSPIGTHLTGSDHPENLRWFKVEPIKWIVLNFNKYKDKINEAIGYQTEIDTLYVPQGATLELYAADVLMAGIPFGVENHTSWEGSSMYQYLNDVFLDQAFSIDEARHIQMSTIYNNRKGNGTISGESLPEYNSSSNHLPLSVNGENETIQKIYLLSYYEMANTNSPYGTNGNKIFTNNENRQVGGTDYARAHNLVLYSSEKTEYWTRTANSGTNVYRVHYTGTFSTTTNATYAYQGTRPA